MADGSRSSALRSTQENALVRWLMPSVADLIFVALLGSLLFTPLSVKLLGDAGIGWHIRTGELILTTHAIPRVDPFSSQVDKPWIAWEWLYDTFVGWLDSHAGLSGVVWLTAVVIASVFATTFRLLLRRGADLLIALVLILLAIGASMIHFLARPHVLSWLLALIWFWILSSYESPSDARTTRHIWLLPVLMLVWVNVHGGFLLGFVLLTIFWLGSLWMWLRLKDSRIEEALEKIAAAKRVQALTFVGLISAAASLVNPYGWHLHEHIFGYLGSRFFMDHIDEFQSPNFHGIAQRCFLVLLLISIGALIAKGRKLRIHEVLLVLFAVYAGLYASRNIPVSAILLVLVIGPIIPSQGLSRFAEKMHVVDSKLRGHLWPIVATAATFLIALNGGRAASAQLIDAHFDPQRMPVAAIDYLERAGIKRTRVLSTDYWGGYLIYREYVVNRPYPRYQVVIDDRHDFYGESFLRCYVTMLHIGAGWENFLRGRSVVLLPTNAALTPILNRSPEWRAFYSDDVATVFVPRNFRPGVD